MTQSNPSVPVTKQSLAMTTSSPNQGGTRFLRYLRSRGHRLSVLTVGGLLAVQLLPVWLWPLFASQDGPSHLYNAFVLRECLAGRGPSTAVYEVAWRPMPNWGGSLFQVALLKVFPPSFVPPMMQTIMGTALVLAGLWLRRQLGSPRGLTWAAATLCCLATGRAWALGFEGFCLGSAAAMATIGLWQHYRERLDLPKSLAIGGLLTLVFFCHLIPWTFAASVIGALAIVGSPKGQAHCRAWTAAILITALPCFLAYIRLRAGHEGSLEFDWSHLDGFPTAGLGFWRRLLNRVDCIGLMAYTAPFTEHSWVSSINSSNLSVSSHGSKALTLILFRPFTFLSAAVVLQALGTLLNDIRLRDYGHVAWSVLGFCGVVLAMFMPDGMASQGSVLPLRIMLLSLILLTAYARVRVGAVITVGSCCLVTVGFVLHTASLWDYAATASAKLLQVQRAAAMIPEGRRIFQLSTNERLRFRTNPLLHSDAYLALWSRGILLSNYEAARYYFPVKLRAAYPEALVLEATKQPSLDPPGKGDNLPVERFLRDYEQYIDILVVRSVDSRLLALAQGFFSKILWHEDDFWVLAREDVSKAALGSDWVIR